MIVTLDAERVGYLDSENVVAVVGNDVFSDVGRGTLHTSLEVYYRAATATEPALTLLQQRAPVLRGLNGAYAKEISEFVKLHSFAEVLLLLSADATRRIDSQIVGSQLRYLKFGEVSKEGDKESSTSNATSSSISTATSATSSSSSTHMASLIAGVKQLEQETEEVVLKRGTVSWHLNAIFNEPNTNNDGNQLPTLTTLVHFVHEGYNFPEGLAMASAIAQGFHLNIPTIVVPGPDNTSQTRFNWVLPSSWRHVIRSPLPDPRVFG